MLPEYKADPRRMALHIPADCMSLQIQTTTACNARCRFCPHTDYYEGKETGMMQEALFLRILEEVKEYRFYKVMPYLQNEPLCDPRIGWFLGRMKEMLKYDHMEISVNPAALSHHASEELARVLSDTPHEIRVSFHGINAESFEKNMGIPFSLSLEHVLHFLAVAQENGLKVMIKGLGMPRSEGCWDVKMFSEEQFLAFWEFQCQSHGIHFDGIDFRYGMFHNRSDYVSGIQEGERIVRDSLEGFYCSRVNKWFHFLFDGTMILCCNDYNRETAFGNIRNQSLQDILQGEAYSRLNGQVLGRQPCPPDFICKRCTSVGG